MTNRMSRLKFFLLLTLSTISLLIVTSLAQAVIGTCSGEMSHYWKLDETGPPSYEDFYGTNAAGCTNCPAAATGIVNGAQQFNGIDNEVNVADDDTFDWGNTGSFSIEFWMKTDSSSTCLGNQVIVGRDDSSTDLHWWVGCSDGSGAAAFVLTDTSDAGTSVSGSTDLTDGSWHHIVAVRDADLYQIRLYVDGTMEDSTLITYSAGFDSFTESLNIGWLNLDSGYHFNGSVDEVALYNRTLSDNEISQHYYDGSVGLNRGYCGCGSEVAIMPLGNSITYGIGEISELEGVDYAVGYRQKLYLDLTGASYEVNFVGSLSNGALAADPFDTDHEGHGGSPDDEVALYVYDWLAVNPADVVLLHIGTNELDPSPADVESILNEIDRYETDSSTEVTVVLARIIDQDPINPTVTTFNDNVQAMAETRIASGDKIIIVDQQSALNYPDDIWDGLHPNTTGYNKMSDVWLAALETFLPVCSVPLEITSDPVIEAGIDGEYSYNVNATSGHTVTYNLLTFPFGMTIDPVIGNIAWSPYADSNIDVTVEAINTTGSVTQDFTINVVDYPADMIHYWKMDDTSGSQYHDFYGSNHATCSQCPTAAIGKIDGGIGNGGIGSGYGAQQFNGIDNEVNAADDDTFDWGNTDSFSIEFWMKTDSSTCSGNQVIVGRDDSATGLHWWVGCQGVNGFAGFMLADTSDTGIFLSGSTDLTDGSWHHIVAVRVADLNENRLYVNGALEGSTPITYSAGFDSVAAGLNIGWLNLDSGYHFNGRVDEVALYNRALTTGEISEHFNNGSSGNGYGTQFAYAPDIYVTDSIGDVSDLQMPFVDTKEFMSSAPATVTISNTGDDYLLISDIQLAGANPGQFELDLNGGASPCGIGPNIIPTDFCTVNITFSPTSEGAKAASLVITSNDSNENPVTVALTGTGLSSVVYVPDINVTDSIDFGNITELDSSAPATVTISNAGNTYLAVSNIQLAGTNAGEFELDVNGGTGSCGTAINITAGGSCTVTITFSPTSEGTKSADLKITSDDPDENPVQVALSGTGLSVVNNPPTAPVLVYPGSGQIDLGTTLDFSWDKSTDPDRDAVRYDLYICENDPNVSCAPIATEIAFLANKGIYFAGTGSGLLLFGIVLAGSERGRRKIALLLVTMMIAATLLVACGSGGGDGPANNPPPSGDITYTVSGLFSGTTYYWKVVAHDGNGNTVDSEIRSFTTQ